MVSRTSRAVTVLAASAWLAGCAGFNQTLAMPNSRGMTLQTLNQQVQPGMARPDVLARLGYPSSRFPVGWQKLDVWNYRFAPPEGDCVVFQVSFSTATGLVTETGQGYDSACDGPSGRD